MFSQLTSKISNLYHSLTGKYTFSEDVLTPLLQDLKESLLESDVNYQVVQKILENLQQKLLHKKALKNLSLQETFLKVLHEEFSTLLTSKIFDIQSYPEIITVVGLNGSGKTTFLGKLGLFLKTKKKSLYYIPADNQRPAAKEQLIIHANSLGAEYFDSNLSDSIEIIIKKGLEEAHRLKKDIILIDTAGRLEIDQNLMKELSQIQPLIKNHPVFLVADAFLGQQACSVVKKFEEILPLTGIVLSKMDADTKAGAALSMKSVTNLPIQFLSTGEKLIDLEVFHADRIIDRMLDKGDLKTLFEKIETVSKKEDSADFLKKIENKSFNFYDFMNQMKSLEKLGSFSSLLKFLPGFQGLKNQVDISSIEQEIQGFKVMIDSMTQQERLSESLLKNPSRIERIARGSGKKTADVLGFYKKFLDTKNMLHQFAPGLKTGNLSPEVQKKMQDSLNKKPKNTQSPYGKKFF